MNDVTCGVKTFKRPNCVRRLLDSIYYHYPEMAVVVVDDSKEPSIDPDDYPNVTYSRMPFDSGLGAGRNQMIDLVKTKYCLYLDDDFVFTEASKIEKFRAILETDKVDLVGGFVEEKRGGSRHVRKYHGRVKVDKNGKLVYWRADYGTDSVQFEGEQLKFKLVDITLNFFLARTALLQKVKWDPKLKINTHSDFFIRAKDQMRIAFCSAVGVFHQPEHPGDYMKFRGRKYRPYILKKHGATTFQKKGQWR